MKKQLVIFILTIFITSNNVLASDWQFEFEPYLMITSIDGDAGVGRIEGTPVNLGFDTILENLEMAAMLHFEAHNNNGWGLAIDYGFMNLGSDITSANGGILDVSVHQGVLETLIVKRNQTDERTIDFTFGVRWWDNDVDVLIDSAILPGSTSLEIKEDWIDLVVGMRLKQKLSQNWDFILQGDIGGAGSDFTSSVATGFNYQMNENWTLDLKYKATWVDYQEGVAGEPDSFSYDTVTHGTLVGFNYHF